MTMPPGFLEDAVDLHVHSAPDVDVRRFDEVASELDRGARLACFAMDPRSLCLRWDRPQRNRGRLKPCRCEVA